MAIRELGSKALRGAPIFGLVRFLYRSVFDRHALAKARAKTKFYSQFIRRGDLVFDVGAHVGDYAEVFCDLGARVIAVEPVASSAQLLRDRLRKRQTVVEECALGKDEGTAELHVGSLTNLSTLSQEWMHAYSLIHPENRWSETVQIRVRTLDALARQYGNPTFVKIDTEGFDDQVLEGMSFRPAALSFEYLPPIIFVAMSCLSVLPDYKFDYTTELEMSLQLGEWVSAREMRDLLATLPGTVRFGDIFAAHDH